MPYSGLNHALLLLDEQPVTLELPDEAAVARMRGQAEALGVRCG